MSFNFVAPVTIHSDFGAQENEICHSFHIFPICLPLSYRAFICLMLNFNPAFPLSPLTFIKMLFSSCLLSAIKVVSPPGSSVHGILQARVLGWVAIFFFRGSTGTRDRTQVSCIAGRCFNLWATSEAPLIWIASWSYGLYCSLLPW